MSTPRTKPGKHGTLYLYELAYTDATDPIGFGPQTHRVWAYNLEHAEEKFWEAPDGDTGWRLIAIARVPESGSMRQAKKYTPVSTFGEG